MSKKKTPPKMKHFEDLKKSSKARCTNLMYVIYKEQMKCLKAANIVTERSVFRWRDLRP